MNYLDRGWELLYNGFARLWKADNGHLVLNVSNSVGFLVHNKDDDTVLFTQQKRKPMVNDNNPDGDILEVPAGRFDLEIGVAGLVVKELSEEMGIVVSEDDVLLLNKAIPLALSPGIITEVQYLAFVSVTNNQIEDPSKIGTSEDRIFGEDSDEFIVRKKVHVDELEKMQFDDMKTLALVQWFLKEQERKKVEGCLARIAQLEDKVTQQESKLKAVMVFVDVIQESGSEAIKNVLEVRALIESFKNISSEGGEA